MSFEERYHSEQSKQKMSLAHRGKIAWNKGLTKADPRVAKGIKIGVVSRIGRTPWNKGKICPKIKPNLASSPELSYILGVLTGDGWTSISKPGSYCLGLHNSDKQFAEEFSESLKKIGLNSNYFTYVNRGWGSKLMYRVYAYSRIAVEWYRQLTLGKIEDIASEYPTEFLRGFFQSEGSKCTDYVRVYNNDKNLLEMISRITIQLGFDLHLYKYLSSSYRRQAYILDVHGGQQKREEFLKLIECPVPV